MKEILLYLARLSESCRNTSEYHHLVRVAKDQICVSEQASICLPMASNKIVKEICNALLTRADDCRTLTQWAAILNVSCRTISRQFRQDTGMSFVEYRHQARLFNALRLLD